MIGEVDLFGVFVPLLLLLGAIALVLTGVLTQVLSWLGAYRVVAYRPLVDLALFILILGLLSFLSGTKIVT
ncbi:MAG TPA: DUF1656 domain-containing protein [Sphingomonadaceae bacterium]|jgi:hypothetical protein|nr:DUF1656 domain-containing protein [Sphingomonadaceae bacterium]